ncbi:MAG: hypothetical protein COW01_06155 [Bdellovibrionales bacterium CG12_big_fil_rev_8_21_14_0_65_38_15]|nr:MAG: hypothetical protein COW79_04050 [Bdellovibrionales bacterium CG22_combo_CG10-13_8_21_14_all_38_13]PIQ56011.1 MAG: hypothetical protein COW01_06155 [Bdellovibrionales bacterium CG12_big_fil_rev_8_21_14_0_65_38_15]PIR30616.1 MAG: hypothetical protein COV38_04695 [Bdellovibrionales bacterium CG11_big_fil_rev_8_21_14_0_20_38_13]
MMKSNNVARHGDNSTSESDKLFDNLIWLTTNEVAIYLRRLTKDGKPSTGAIRNLIYRGKLRARKFCGKLYFKRSEIDRLIETSELIGGI